MEDPPGLCFPHWELISSACCVFMWAVRCTHVSSCAWWNLPPTSNPTTPRLNNVWTVDISEEAETRKDALSGWLSMEFFFFLHLQFFPPINRVSTLTTSSTEMRKVPQLVLFRVLDPVVEIYPLWGQQRPNQLQPHSPPGSRLVFAPSQHDMLKVRQCVDFSSKIHLFAWGCKKRAKCVVFLEMYKVLFTHIIKRGCNMGHLIVM